MKNDTYIVILIFLVFALFLYEIGGIVFAFCGLLFFAGLYLALIGISGLTFFIFERIQQYRKRNRKAQRKTIRF